MITREEFDRKYFIAKSQSAKNEACLEYINSLESQLSSNPLQLTCDGCKSNHNTQSFYCSTCERLPRRDYYEPKDTK